MNTNSSEEQELELLSKSSASGHGVITITKRSDRSGGTVKSQADTVIIAEEEEEEEAARNVEVAVLWENVSYSIKSKDFWKELAAGRVASAFRTKEHVILQKQSGYIKTGSLTAVLGKSGSGKTSLIESLAGRRFKGLDGSISVTAKLGENSCHQFKPKHVRLAFIPQHDNLLSTLTVEESLRFASRLKNVYTSDSNYHRKVTENLIKQLDLETCRNVYANSCSGGQKKRLSIAMELVNKPTVLVLDEPTSGLDSSSALQCVSLLRSLTENPKNPLAILVTIHQPSAKTLFLFHQIYLLSHNGRCIYFGPVPSLLTHFSKYGLVCPEFHNPAEYAIRIACGEYGEDVIKKREIEQRSASRELLLPYENCNKFPISNIIRDSDRKSCLTFVRHTYTLLFRTVLITLRDPVLNLCRLLPHIFIALILASMYERAVGEENGCVSTSGIISYESIVQKQSLTRQNVALLFFSVLFLSFASMMPTVAVFPLEMSVFLKERTNGWYSCLSYYIAKTLADVPFQSFYTLIYMLIIYYLTGQVQSHWRFSTVLIVFLIVSIIGQSYGLLAGAIFCSNINAAILVAIASCSSLILISGFIVRVATLASYLQPVTYLSHMKYGFEAVMVSLYGYGRCEWASIEVSSNTTSFLNEACSEVFQLFKYLQALNISYPSLRPLLDSYIETVNVPQLGITSVDEQINQLSELKLEWPDSISNKTLKVSIVLKEFGLSDDTLFFNIQILILILLFVRIFTYAVFLSKANTTNK